MLFKFSIAKSVNDGEYFPISSDIVERTNPDGSKTKDIITTKHLRVVLVLYKDELPYRWMECTYTEQDSYINLLKNKEKVG